jgi:hypothetical protein
VATKTQIRNGAAQLILSGVGMGIMTIGAVLFYGSVNVLFGQ